MPHLGNMDYMLVGGVDLHGAHVSKSYEALDLLQLIPCDSIRPYAMLLFDAAHGHTEVAGTFAKNLDKEGIVSEDTDPDGAGPDTLVRPLFDGDFFERIHRVIPMTTYPGFCSKPVM
jgi:hypothetical protein